jgi:lipoprotein signal peptidase
MVVSLIKSIPLIVLLVSLDFASKRYFYSAGNAILNDGISFGLFPGNNAVLITISLIAIGIFCGMLALSRNNMSMYGTSLVFMISGAIGNLIDRIQIGAVIDFIDLGFFPVFNFADTYLSLGVLLMFLVTFIPKKNHNNAHAHHNAHKMKHHAQKMHKKHIIHQKKINKKMKH